MSIDLHAVSSPEKCFERIDYMVMKHVPKAYKLFKSLQIKNFGEAPSCYDADKKRNYTRWAWTKMEEGEGVWY
jgi:hypothetical protein